MFYDEKFSILFCIPYSLTDNLSGIKKIIFQLITYGIKIKASMES